VDVAGTLESYECIKAESAKEGGADSETELDGLGVGIDPVGIGLVVAKVACPPRTQNPLNGEQPPQP